MEGNLHEQYMLAPGRPVVRVCGKAVRTLPELGGGAANGSRGPDDHLDHNSGNDRTMRVVRRLGARYTERQTFARAVQIG